ncbi:hypothetical protein ACFQX8_17815 [Klenkia terrae]|uniref:hypothetical protein n=1 Tax=Klenkia terrae TaxID=1052259 RepID=UPI0036104BEA
MENHVAGGLLILALNGTGILGSLATRGLAPSTGMVTGALVFVVGVLGTIGALAAASLTAFYVAAVVSGFGFGAAFLGAMATVTQGVDAGERAGLLSAVFTVSYLAFSLPAIAAGLAIGPLGLTTTAEVYGAVVVALALTAVAGLVRDRRPVPVTGG